MTRDPAILDMIDEHITARDAHDEHGDGARLGTMPDTTMASANATCAIPDAAAVTGAARNDERAGE